MYNEEEMTMLLLLKEIQVCEQSPILIYIKNYFNGKIFIYRLLLISDCVYIQFFLPDGALIVSFFIFQQIEE